MNNPCGSQRCEQKGQLPVHAWKLDNSLPIRDDEILIALTKIHLENGSFNQIYNESNGNDKKMIEVIQRIVDMRCKLHNPYTGTGGMICGRVKEIGKNCHVKNINVGDEVLVPVSAAVLPIHIDRIKSIDVIYGHVDVEGYGIVYDGCLLVKKTGDTSWDTMLCCFEESASIHRTMELAHGKKNVLIIGSNPVIMLLYGIAMNEVLKEDGTLTGVVFDDILSSSYEGVEQKRNKALYSVFDEAYFARGKSELDIVDQVTHEEERLFDLVINCADQTGAEAISVLSTKPYGTIFFSNLTNNYTIALLLQESISRPMSMECAYGYVEGYQQSMVDFLAKHKDEIEYIESKLGETRSLKRTAGQKEENVSETQELILRTLHTGSSAMRELGQAIEKTSKFDCNVVITGESGAGKEVVANTIYKLSERNGYPIIKVNCAAIPKELMESEFFGYEKGAFTGASSSGKAGFLELADKGILFLDEICDMPLEMQAKLLRVIQEGEFYRVGGSTPVSVNVRFFAATNKPIKKMIKTGEFREDLYYRLSVVELKIPSLKERRGDIPKLTRHFLNKYNEKYGSNAQISDEALDILKEKDWPGNVRELENFVQKLIIASYGEDSDTITGATIIGVAGGEKHAASQPSNTRTFAERVEALEVQLIQQALENFGSTYKAAHELGMTQSQFMRKKKKYGI